MNLIEKVSLRVCEKLIEKYFVADRCVINFDATLMLQNEEESVELQIITKENEYKFFLHLIQNEKDSNCKSNTLFYSYPIFYIDENMPVLIKDISIKGYDAIQFEELDLILLKLILKTLASGHSRSIKESYLDKLSIPPSDTIMTEECDISDIQDVLLIIKTGELEYVNKFEPDILLEGLEKLISSRNALHKEDCLYVKGNIIQKKLLVRSIGQPRDCKILNIGLDTPTPLVYDVLLTIFSFSNQMLRQHHFHDLLDYYYGILKENLCTFSLDITKILPLEIYEKQTHIFIPYIKLEILKRHCQSFLKDFNVMTNITNLRKNSLLDNTRDLIWTSIMEMNEYVLHPDVTREDCYQIIKNKLGSSEYKLLNYKLTPVGERNGFLGDYFELKINILQGGEDKRLNLFAKYLPSGMELTRILALNSFKKEEFFYRIFVPEIIQQGLGDLSDFVPKCYFSRTHDVLVFEDMSAMNYRPISVNIPFSYNLLQIVIKQLAKIHACSLLYEEILKNETGKIVTLDNLYEEYVKEMIFGNKEEVRKSTDCGMNAFLNMFDLFPDIPKEMTMEEFKKKAKRIYDLAYEKVKKSDRFRNVICQGDCWTSNILFKMNDNDTPVNCCILDYQLIRYCPPAHDIFHLFYMVTNKEVRTKYMYKLLEEYYLELSIILKKYNVDLNSIYTYENFLDSCNYMKSQGLCHAALILQIVLYPKEKMNMILKDAKRADHLFSVDRKEFLEEMQCNEVYRQRMGGLIEDFYEICKTDFL